MLSTASYGVLFALGLRARQVSAVKQTHGGVVTVAGHVNDNKPINANQSSLRLSAKSVKFAFATIKQYGSNKLWNFRLPYKY
jgi:hypothetical protein